MSLPAWRDGRPLYLAELILALGWSAVDLTWQCRNLEIGPGPGVSPLEEAAATDEKLTSLELLHLATPYVQVIEGEVIAYKDQGEKARRMVVLRAVDSSSWDLEFSDDSGFQRIVAAFPEATELDPKLFG
ncbi:MAG: hypothetical protein ACT4NY_24045 [Pseudonocardiales bacterium]